jgi:MYXO-CTERM domain-containing protein
MKLVTLLSLTMSAGAFAATGIFGSYINVTSSNFGGSPIWYDAQAPLGGRASNPTDFNGFAFGSYNPGAGGVLNLTGAEVLTFKGGSPDDVTGAKINYRIYSAGFPSGSFTPVSIFFTANATFADAAGTSYTNGGDQKWSNGVSSTNLLTGLSNGNYELDIYLEASTNTGTAFSNNGGSNFKATFSVVPEPTSAALGLIGAALLLRRRRF